MVNDAAFLFQLKAGNGEAFSQLLAAHRKTVINICYRFFLNQEDAEDISQEVFIEVYHSLKNFRGDSKLSTWIHRIAVSKSLDEIKKRNSKKRIKSLGEIIGLEDVANWVVGKERPDKTYEDKEGYQKLLDALNKLPENQRIAITLSKVEGYSNPEIAELMQTTLTAVDSLIYRAKQQLKSKLNR